MCFKAVLSVVTLNKMNESFLLIVFLTLWDTLPLNIVYTQHSTTRDEDTLRLVHVLFRHGDRNPDDFNIIPSSPYYNESYYSEGYGQLTNAGKLREYKLGSSLRKRYDKFLSDTYNINYLEARSTDRNRTKMSLELVLAGLYPPKNEQLWSVIPWQPIPYNYYPGIEDKEIQAWKACNKFFPLLNELFATPEAKKYLQRYDELFAIFKEKTGLSSITVFDVLIYYAGFLTQEEIGYPLEEWTTDIYPEPINSAAVDFYYYATNTTAIRRVITGYLIKKILSDTKAKIEGILTPSSRKMFLYSAHETNVATALLALDAYKLTDIPPYGAYVIFEVHEINNVWGIKLFYQNYENVDPIAIKLPACDYFCPYDQFYSLVEKILPESESDCNI